MSFADISLAIFTCFYVQCEHKDSGADEVFSAPRSVRLHMGKMSALIRESELECDVPNNNSNSKQNVSVIWKSW